MQTPYKGSHKELEREKDGAIQPQYHKYIIRNRFGVENRSLIRVSLVSDKGNVVSKIKIMSELSISFHLSCFLQTRTTDSTKEQHRYYC